MSGYKEKILLENIGTIKVIVRKLMGSYGLALNDYEDYLQEAYIMIFNKADKYDENKEFYNFAYSVIKNGFIDLYRKDTERRIEKVSLDESVFTDCDSETVEISYMLKSDMDTENEGLQNISMDMMREYFSDMKKKYSAKTTVKGFEALELKIAGYSGEEIAKMFNVPSNSVRSWMSKVKKILVADERFLDLLSIS